MSSSFFPSLANLEKQLPLTFEQKQFIATSRRQAISIFQRSDPRLVVIIGPCSIHDPKAALDYAEKLKALSLQVEHQFFLIMRLFCEKPRTKNAWNGFLYDPDLNGSNNTEKGIFLTRELFLTLTDLEIPIATEFLNPLTAPFFQDLVTWGFIGARTSASFPHRQMAANFSFPLGFKNSLYGELEPAIFGIHTAQKSQRFLGLDQNGTLCMKSCSGNPYTHLVLRGSEYGPNYDQESIYKALLSLKHHALIPRLLIDCAHGNSAKDPFKQLKVFHSIFSQAKQLPQNILGMMLESHLEEGKQFHYAALEKLRYGVSITDPCLGWPETERLLQTASSTVAFSLASINSTQR